MLHAALLLFASALPLLSVPDVGAQEARAATWVETREQATGASALTLSRGEGTRLPLALDSALVALLPPSFASGATFDVPADPPAATFRCGDQFYFTYAGAKTGNACAVKLEDAIANARANFVDWLLANSPFICEDCAVPGECNRYAAMLDSGWTVTDQVKVLGQWCVTVKYNGIYSIGCTACLM